MTDDAASVRLLLAEQPDPLLGADLDGRLVLTLILGVPVINEVLVRPTEQAD